MLSIVGIQKKLKAGVYTRKSTGDGLALVQGFVSCARASWSAGAFLQSLSRYGRAGLQRLTWRTKVMEEISCRRVCEGPSMAERIWAGSLGQENTLSKDVEATDRTGGLPYSWPEPVSFLDLITAAPGPKRQTSDFSFQDPL